MWMKRKRKQLYILFLIIKKYFHKITSLFAWRLKKEIQLEWRKKNPRLETYIKFI